MFAARRAAGQIFSRTYRRIVFRSIGVTILLLFGLWYGLTTATNWLLSYEIAGWLWLVTALSWLLGIGLFVGAVFLIAPVSALFAGLFLDEVALKGEQLDYPEDPPGKPLEFAASLGHSINFTLFVLAANLVALLLVLLPGINFAVFFLLNGYLLGREYFQFIAMRFVDYGQAKALRKRHEGTVFLGGMIISGFMAIPVLNLATPIFATLMMLHLFKALTFEEFPPGANAHSLDMAA